MKKLQFKKEINVNAQKVYETMLGLKNKSNYEFLTVVFNPPIPFAANRRYTKFASQ
jgi:hypothetical protein